MGNFTLRNNLQIVVNYACGHAVATFALMAPIYVTCNCGAGISRPMKIPSENLVHAVAAPVQLRSSTGEQTHATHGVSPHKIVSLLAWHSFGERRPRHTRCGHAAPRPRRAPLHCRKGLGSVRMPKKRQPISRAFSSSPKRKEPAHPTSVTGPRNAQPVP